MENVEPEKGSMAGPRCKGVSESNSYFGSEDHFLGEGDRCECKKYVWSAIVDLHRYPDIIVVHMPYKQQEIF